MKTFGMCCLLAMFLIACQDTPENLTGVPKITSPSRYQSGTRLAKFGDNSGIAIIFVDTKQNLVSIHSLQKDLNLENPICVGRLSKVIDSQDIDIFQPPNAFMVNRIIKAAPAK